LSATGIVGRQRSSLAPDDPRLLIPIEEVSVLLDVSVALLKRQHLADPDAYPAERIGVLWRIPTAWVRSLGRWPREVSTP
jgi:hypothetical protein